MADHTVWHCVNCNKAFLEEDMKHQQTTMDAYVCDPVHYFSGDYLTIDECPYCGAEEIKESDDRAEIYWTLEDGDERAEMINEWMDEDCTDDTAERNRWICDFIDEVTDYWKKKHAKNRVR
jgi:DNA-directed RNA polymerase subunit RPC12/RpoP